MDKTARPSGRQYKHVQPYRLPSGPDPCCHAVNWLNHGGGTPCVFRLVDGQWCALAVEPSQSWPQWGGVVTII